MKYPIAYVVTLVVFVGVDFVWLSRMADSFYRPAMGDMLAAQFKLAPAAAFYLLFAVGIVALAVAPAFAAQDWRIATGYGFLLGLVGYGVYDLTNQATLKTWPLSLTLVDMAWGAVLTALAASAGYAAGRWT